PTVITILSAVAVLLYGFWWIPKQQRELNERNFRILIAQSARIKAKVDNFDSVLDHAVVALGGWDKIHTAKRLGAFIRTLTPDLEILDDDDSTFGARRARELAEDPPTILIERDEGANYLYLGFKHRDPAHKSGITVVARANAEDIASKLLSTGRDFDALLLVTRAGEVIVEQAKSGLHLARLDSMRYQVAPEHSNKAPESFDALAGSRNLVNVTLGDADYKMYVQPIQLSLYGAPLESDAKKSEAKKSGAKKSKAR